MAHVRPCTTLAASMFLAVAACAAGMQDALKQLQDSIEGYNEAYRWKNYDRAASYLPADLRGTFLATYEDDDNALHVEDFQLLNVNVESDRAATVTVRIRYMELPSVTVERKTLVQHWRRLGDAWILETEENSIRRLAKDKKPKNAEALGGTPETPHREGEETSVEVTAPGGEVIRSEGQVTQDEEPFAQ